MFATVDDFGYNNQVWLLDMQVGKYYLRRAHHVWGPQDQAFQDTRLGPGCTRGNCFDSVRNVLWTAGGTGTSGVGTFRLHSYNVAYDSRNRALLLVKSDHGGDYPPNDPKIPYGTLWVLDLASNTWTQAASGPNARLNLGSMTYDPNLNLAICRSAHRLWVYRSKGGCPTDAFQTQ
jgi:hypothetical protein